MSDRLIFGVDSVVREEWCVFTAFLVPIVVCELRHWSERLPIILLIVDVCLEVLFQSGICPFHLSILLQVQCCTQSSFNSQLFGCFLPQVGCKYGSPICYDVLGKSV